MGIKQLNKLIRLYTPLTTIKVYELKGQYQGGRVPSTLGWTRQNVSPKKEHECVPGRSLNAPEHLDEWARRRPHEIHKVLHDHVFPGPDQETSADRKELLASGGPGEPGILEIQGVYSGGI